MCKIAWNKTWVRNIWKITWIRSHFYVNFVQKSCLLTCSAVLKCLLSKFNIYGFSWNCEQYWDFEQSRWLEQSGAEHGLDYNSKMQIKPISHNQPTNLKFILEVPLYDVKFLKLCGIGHFGNGQLRKPFFSTKHQFLEILNECSLRGLVHFWSSTKISVDYGDGTHLDHFRR